MAGRTYRVKYTATNAAGLEGPQSPEATILAAVAPTVPQSLARINTQTLPAGHIQVEWAAPASAGGTAVTGYEIFLDGVSHYKSGDGESTLSEYTLTTLTVGRTYAIAVAARNAIGSGPKATLASELAASVPPMLSPPDLHSATSSSITVNATIPTYTGGAPLSAYAYRRDDGPLTGWQGQVT